ncbi:hypothetical protein GGR51DRAFT_549499 [Nemania sp. FL0031]|nr:hypothetical protein GGR51DRAFT_549499 [Nemania sp. FL0031]
MEALRQQLHRTQNDDKATMQNELSKYKSQIVSAERELGLYKQQALEAEEIARKSYADQKADNDTLRRRLEEQSAEIRRLSDQKAENDTLRRRLKERDIEIDDLRQLQLLQDNDRETRLQTTLTSAIERHRSEEAALSRQIDDLRRELEARQSTSSNLHDEISKLKENIRQSEANCQAQAEKIEALEDEIEVLQATLDDESEDANQKLREADELRQDLEHQLELSKREKVQQTDRLGQLENTNILETADRVAEKLRQQLEETKEDLQDAELECQELKQKMDGASRQESKAVTQANQASEDLGRQLLSAQKESKKARLLCEDLRSQLDAAKRDLEYVNPLCKELRQKLDRARSERAQFQASAVKLEVDCERLKKGAQDALAWIQAKNAEQPTLIIPNGPIKKATTTTFRYGDIVRDVVDQKDHEAVIRAANSAQRRHEKEIRGMALQMEWMQARWERESKLRNDSAFAKKFLQLRLDIADACNKADLRILNRIHQDLGLKSTAELLAKRQKNRKPVNNLKVFVGVIRAVARMRIEARKWGEHEKTRRRLVAAWEEQKQNQNQVVCT